MTVVFVHGVLQTSEVWDMLRARVDDESVAVSLPGIGGALPPGFGASKDEYADWLCATLHEVDGPIDLVGHDWGALLTLRIATAFSLPLRSWSVDAAHGFHPDYAWPRSVRIALRDRSFDPWLRDGPARLVRLGSHRPSRAPWPRLIPTRRARACSRSMARRFPTCTSTGAPRPPARPAHRDSS